MYNKPADGAKLPMQLGNEQYGKRILEPTSSLNLAIFVALLDRDICGFEADRYGSPGGTFITYYLSLITYYLLLTNYHLLLITYYLSYHLSHPKTAGNSIVHSL